MPVPRNTMILITPAIDLLLYPIASVGYLPPLFRQPRRRLSSVILDGQSVSLDTQLSIRKTVAMSLADRLEADIAGLLEMCTFGPKKNVGLLEELPLRMLRSLEGVLRELSAGIELDEQQTEFKPWPALERKLQELGKHVRTVQAEQQAYAALDDMRTYNTHASSVGSPRLPPMALQNDELESTGATQQCYELIAGNCAILCLETIMVCVEILHQKTAKLSSADLPPALPVAAKTFVFAGMQSGAVVIYDATSASVAPISFQAHVGGVLAMAIYANPRTAGSVSCGGITVCEECGCALPEVFLLTGGSDTSLALWDLSPLLFGGREPRLLCGKPILIDGPKVSIAADDLLAVRLTFLPHQGDVLSLLVGDSCSDCRRTNGFRHDAGARVCTVEACDSCLPGVKAAMRFEGAAGRAFADSSSPPINSFSSTEFQKAESPSCSNDTETNQLIFIGFQSAKIGAVMMSDLLRYYRHSQVMVSVLANAVSFQPAQQSALPLRVSRDFELQTLATGQLRVMFSSEQERESLRSLFTRNPTGTRSISRVERPESPKRMEASSPTSCNSPSLGADATFRSMLAGFARNLRCVTLHASHSATTFWPAKWCCSGRPGCIYPPTGTVYCFEAPPEQEVPLPEGAAASASPGTYRVVTSTSSLKIVAQPSREHGGLKIEMRFLPFEQSGVQRQLSNKLLVGPWLDESGHNGFVECLICCGKKVVCSGGGDGRLLLWGEGGKLVGQLAGHHGGILCVAYTEAPTESPCRDLRTPQERKPEIDAEARGLSPTTSDDGLEGLQGLLFSGSRDSSIRVWALEQLVCIQTLNAHTSEVLALAADASRNILVSGSANGELFVWQLDLMVVAFNLSLSTNHMNVGKGLFSGVDGQRILRSRSVDGQDDGVSFTAILLISDFSSLHTNEVGSTDGSPRTSTVANNKPPTGLQLWAARGDGKLGVWNLSETGAIDDGFVNAEEAFMDESYADVAQEAHLQGTEESEAAVSKTVPVTTDAVSAQLPAGRVRPHTVTGQEALKDGQQCGQRKLPSRRLSGMIVSPGASMPSLPSLTTGTGLEPRRTDFLPLLAQFVAYKSVSASRSHPYLSGCIGAAKFVAQLFEQSLGANVDVVWPRSSGGSEFAENSEEQPHPVVFARLGNSVQHPTVVFYSHYDVVPAESVPGPTPPPSDLSDCHASPTSAKSPRAASPSAPASFKKPLRRHSSCEATKNGGANQKNVSRIPSKEQDWQGTGWSTNPWKVHCKDGYIYGRGVTDNKGPIICSLLAVKQFIAEWRRKHRGRHALQNFSDGTNNEGTGSHVAPSIKNDPGIPFNFVWICEGDEENGSTGKVSRGKCLEVFALCTSSAFLYELQQRRNNFPTPEMYAWWQLEVA